MNLLRDLIKKCAKNKDEEKIYFVIIERLKPWIVLNCLEKENYIITDNQAENLAATIIKQAVSMRVMDKIVKKMRLV